MSQYQKIATLFDRSLGHIHEVSLLTAGYWLRSGEIAFCRKQSAVLSIASSNTSATASIRYFKLPSHGCRLNARNGNKILAATPMTENNSAHRDWLTAPHRASRQRTIYAENGAQDQRLPKPKFHANNSQSRCFMHNFATRRER